MTVEVEAALRHAKDGGSIAAEWTRAITPAVAPMPLPVTAHGQVGRPKINRLKAFLASVTCLLLIASVATSYFITKRQSALGQLSRYNVTWLASQAPVEVTRLEAAIAETMVPGSGADKEEIELRLDIVRNRIELLSQGDANEFLREEPALKTIIIQLRTTVEKVQLLLDEAGHDVNVNQLLKLVAPLIPQLVKVAAAANTFSGELVARDQAQLSRLHLVFSAIIGGLLLCGFGLLGLATWHNKMLRRSHDDVKALVHSLQAAGSELADANTRVKATMDEVQLQNQILQERDRTLNTQNARFDAALNNMSQALCMVDRDQRVIVCNIRFLELFGLTAGMVRPGARIDDVFRNAAAIGRYEQAVIGAICDEQRELVVAGRAASFFQEDSSGRAVAISHQPMGGSGWVATYEDISERRRVEARINFMAHHDALTSLPNRVRFKEQLELVLGNPQGNDRSGAVLCLDLDHFKDVNDSLGHPAGDQLLEVVAQRLRGCCRDTDVVARLGGDEFAILQSCANQPAAAEALALRVIEAVSAPYQIDGARVVVGTSIGISVVGVGNDQADHLLKNADMALYRAKADGRGTYRFFEVEMDIQLQIRRATEMDLREAVAKRELIVFYQPLFDLAANKVTGFEALLRWRHPVNGMISPAQFIPIAEELGLISTIGEWVLEQACCDAATWPHDVKVAVNLSPVQFRSNNLLEVVRSALQNSGLPPSRLELEITETALLQNTDKVLETLHELRSLGVKTSLDDFGTGYSSLSYLRVFPFDKIKIDQSFVREMSNGPDCLAIVQSVAQLARKLGMATTAEGVETKEQLDQVRDAGCTQAQGFYFDRPQPAAEIRHWFTHPVQRLEVAALPVASSRPTEPANAMSS